MNSGKITTYKEFIDFFRLLCLDHMQVHDFQVGQMSDIDVQRDKDNPTKYPLVFLLPQRAQLAFGGKMTLSFSMIVADITREDLEIEIDAHNRTLMIAQDIISRIRKTTPNEIDFNIEDPVDLIPFRESYNNRLSGWSVEINIILKSPYDNCNAAFYNLI